MAAQSGPPRSIPNSKMRAAGTSRASRAATLAEVVAAIAPIETIAPEVAAIFSMPGRCATWSGIKSANARGR